MAGSVAVAAIASGQQWSRWVPSWSPPSRDSPGGCRSGRLRSAGDRGGCRRGRLRPAIVPVVVAAGRLGPAVAAVDAARVALVPQWSPWLLSSWSLSARGRRGGCRRSRFRPAVAARDAGAVASLSRQWPSRNGGDPSGDGLRSPGVYPAVRVRRCLASICRWTPSRRVLLRAYLSSYNLTLAARCIC